VPEATVREVDRRRWRREIIRHLADLPRQYAALENAMAAFGSDFDLARFKSAYETTTDMDAYNRVQAVERALGRVQNYIAELAVTGVNMGGITSLSDTHASDAVRSFVALRDADVISATLCRRLIRTQEARVRIEHSYVSVPAGDVHRAALNVRGATREFLAAYRIWIEPLLNTGYRYTERRTANSE
jgi:hypothetical protein